MKKIVFEMEEDLANIFMEWFWNSGEQNLLETYKGNYKNNKFLFLLEKENNHFIIQELEDY